MANQPLSAINTALGLFKGIKAMLMSLPIIVSTANAIPSQAHSIVITKQQSIQNDHNTLVLEQLATFITAEMPKTIQIIDAVIYLMPMIATEITESEVAEFNQIQQGLEYLVKSITEQSNEATFIQQITHFNEKVRTMHQTLLSERYKQQADNVVSARAYQGEQSVGYRFEQNHSFNDFKKSVLG